MASRRFDQRADHSLSTRLSRLRWYARATLSSGQIALAGSCSISKLEASPTEVSGQSRKTLRN